MDKIIHLVDILEGFVDKLTHLVHKYDFGGQNNRFGGQTLTFGRHN